MRHDILGSNKSSSFLYFFVFPFIFLFLSFLILFRIKFCSCSLHTMTNREPFGTLASFHHDGPVPLRMRTTSCGVLPPSKKIASPLLIRTFFTTPLRSLNLFFFRCHHHTQHWALEPRARYVVYTKTHAHCRDTPGPKKRGTFVSQAAASPRSEISRKTTCF